MFVLMLEAGEEVVSGLEQFAKKNKVAGGQVTATGSLSQVALGYFDRRSKKYKKNVELREAVQVLALSGDIAYDKGRPRLVCHAVVAKGDGGVFGGHLLEARVHGALEVVVMEASQFYQRQYDQETGLALLRPEPQVVRRRKIG